MVTSLLDKGPTPSEEGRARGLGIPPHLKAPFLSPLALQPPNSPLPELPPPGPRSGQAVCHPSVKLAHRLVSRPGRGRSKLWAWRPPSPGPSVPGSLLVIEAPTCVVVRGTCGRRHRAGAASGQRSTGCTHDVLCTEPINVYPELRPPGGPVIAPGTCLFQVPLSLQGRYSRPRARPRVLQGWTCVKADTCVTLVDAARRPPRAG